jgi:hypothetical protein
MLLLAVVLCAAKYVHSIEAIQDLRVASDETVYLRHGIRLRQLGVLDASWSPLYSVWYYALSWLEPDPARLYSLNYKALVAGTTGALYLLVRALGAYPILAAATSIGYLVSNVPMAHPHVGLFALLVMLLTLAAAVRLVSPGSAHLAAGVGISALVFVRPEYVASLVLFPLWVAFSSLRGFDRPRGRDRVRLIAVPGVLVLLLLVFGNPVTGSKQWLTFCGSYLFTHPELIPGPGPTAFPYNCLAVVPAIFGGADSLPSAVLRNAPALLEHVWLNIKAYAQLAAVLPFVTPMPFLSAGVQSLAAYLELALLAVAALPLLAARRGSLRGALPKRFLALASMLCVSSALAALLYYPRSHYLIAQPVLLMACFSGLLAAATKDNAIAHAGPRGAALCGLLLFLLTPSHASGWSLRSLAGKGRGHADLGGRARVLERRFDAAFPSRSLLVQYWLARPFSAPSQQIENYRPVTLLEDRRTLAALRSLTIRSRVNLLSPGDYTAYLPDNYRYVPWMMWLGQPTLRFFDDHPIDVIVVDRIVRADYAHLSEWRALMEAPGEHGFAKVEVPGTQNLLLVRPSATAF